MSTRSTRPGKMFFSSLSSAKPWVFPCFFLFHATTVRKACSPRQKGALPFGRRGEIDKLALDEAGIGRLGPEERPKALSLLGCSSGSFRLARVLFFSVYVF